jgi:flavodoxin
MQRILSALVPALLSLSLMAAAPLAAQEAPAAEPASGGPFGKALVIVFSQTGKTMQLAEAIAAKTGADIYRIESATPFPAEEREIIPLEQARREEGRAPELKGPPPDLAPYSFVFIGSPTWFGSPPDIVTLFLSQLDLGERKAAVFATAGSRPGEVTGELSAAVRGGVILAPSLTCVRADDWSAAAVEAKVDGYLAALAEALSGAAPTQSR